MIALDTPVLARYIAQDDVQPSALANTLTFDKDAAKSAGMTLLE